MTPETETARSPEPVGPGAMVIFGGAGDLTKRKLIPSLYNLSASGLLGERFAVVGVGRTELGDDEYRELLREALRKYVRDLDEKLAEKLLARIGYVRGDLGDKATYAEIGERLRTADSEQATAGNTLFYLATPPRLFAPVVEQLGEAGLAREEDGRWRRVIFEKPFGRDLDSARRLNRDIQKTLAERQIYRIDHYLGKETVQNILIFRFANGIFEPIWNRRYVDHVQITVSESVGVEGRGGYYDKAGALRDMVPNHMFQLLALTAMEPPVSFEPDAVRDEKAKILEALQPLDPEEVLRRTVRGQYAEGRLAGERLPAYRSDPRVADDSRTETYVAFKMLIDNWRWADVPFYLRTGKQLPARLSEIAIQFKHVPFMLFRETPIDRLTPNQLVVRIQPDEGISLSFGAKVPGPAVRIGDVEMDFCYADHFGSAPTTGYETLLHDCMKGDATLFMRADNVERAWDVVTPVLDVWQALPPRDFPNYAAGSAGPAEADELLERDGRRWRSMK